MCSYSSNWIKTNVGRVVARADDGYCVLMHETTRHAKTVSEIFLNCRLCCFPIQLQARYYPLVLVLIFSLFFGPELSLFSGMVVGYLHVWGLFKRVELGATKATEWENK